MSIIKLITVFSFVLLSFSVSAESVWDIQTQVLEKPVDIVVYRSPTCSCCSKWIKHLQSHNFNVKDIIKKDMQAVKKQMQVPAKLGSCHTALVNGYWVEGHVPADDIKKMLSEQPDILGLSVPAMPSGTPGMEMGNRKDPFNVISLDKQGNAQLYKAYGEY